MSPEWKFPDKPNTACFTTASVLNGSPICRGYHDFDGDWQVHGGMNEPAINSQIVCLEDMVLLDPSLMAVHDLPIGWKAVRGAPSQPWTYTRNVPFPYFDEHGYYLEDAVWLSQYWVDLLPPSAEVRENLRSGSIVKLIFRFAHEDSDPKDHQCEQMWVRIVGLDADLHYHGILDNEPNHNAVKYGDELYFHPLHIADVFNE